MVVQQLQPHIAISCEGPSRLSQTSIQITDAAWLPKTWLTCSHFSSHVTQMTSLFSGIRMGSLGLFLQCIIAIFFSTIMDRMVKQFGTRMVYLTSVVLFPFTAFIMCFSQSIVIVTVSAALTGFPFSVLQILPYTLASLYHHEKQVRED